MKKTIFLLSLVLIVSITGCVSEHSDESHEHSVEIEGRDMKLLSVQEIADLWEINSKILLEKIIQEFDLKKEYTVDSILKTIREEYKFSPALIKDIAEKIKKQGQLNE